MIHCFVSVFLFGRTTVGTPTSKYPGMRAAIVVVSVFRLMRAVFVPFRRCRCCGFRFFSPGKARSAQKETKQRTSVSSIAQTKSCCLKDSFSVGWPARVHTAAVGKQNAIIAERWSFSPFQTRSQESRPSHSIYSTVLASHMISSISLISNPYLFFRLKQRGPRIKRKTEEAF